jgi:tRNA pseudouridine38-40 synthase
MPKYKLIIEYDGTNFVGWQSQDNGNSVQQSLEKAIHKLTNEQVTVFGAGRTDSGVHAKGQVAHFEISKDLTKDNIRDGVNQYLRPLPIAILNVEKVEEDFHARFSAKQRIYQYLIINRRPPLTFQRQLVWVIYKKLDIEKIKEAATFFKGKHDFNAFRSIDCQSSTSIKTIDYCAVTNNQESIAIEVAAKSFLHSQVRIMTGTLVSVGEGKIQPSDIEQIIEMKDRDKAGVTAPAHGLYLKEVIY